MKKVLAFAAVGEAVTGLGLLIIPSVVSWLLLGTELVGVSVVIARVAGLALIGLGVSCWPSWPALYGMFTYSMLATLYLAFVGFAGGFSGLLLWPAVLLHAALTLLLARACFKP